MNKMGGTFFADEDGVIEIEIGSYKEGREIKTVTLDDFEPKEEVYLELLRGRWR